MGENQRGVEEAEYRRLTREELNKLAGEALPERVAMSLIRAHVAVPINAAIGDYSIEYGGYVEEDAESTQST